LSEREPEVRITDLAELRSVAKASVSEAMDTMAELGLVRQEKYGPVELTRLGREQAREIRERHRILRMFMVEVLDVPLKVAQKDACLMEHIVSPVTMERLVAFLKAHVSSDLHGLLAAEDNEKGAGHMGAAGIQPLSELTPGMKGRVVRIGVKGRLRQRLLDMGVVAGAEVRLDGAAPFGDPIEVTVRGYHLTLRKSEAARIYVEVE